MTINKTSDSSINKKLEKSRIKTLKVNMTTRFYVIELSFYLTKVNFTSGRIIIWVCHCSFPSIDLKVFLVINQVLFDGSFLIKHSDP